MVLMREEKIMLHTENMTQLWARQSVEATLCPKTSPDVRMVVKLKINSSIRQTRAAVRSLEDGSPLSRSCPLLLLYCASILSKMPSS